MLKKKILQYFRDYKNEITETVVFDSKILLYNRYFHFATPSTRGEILAN